MLHAIPKDQHGPLAGPMTHAVEACVHCGFCLAACPTYLELGQEMDTPRGRIVLMKQVLEGTLPWTAAQPHVDRCLGCLACEPACPSGVPYRDLISPFRALAANRFDRALADRLRRWVASKTLPFPRRFRMAAQLGQLARKLPFLVPAPLRPMLQLLPPSLPAAAHLRPVTPARGNRRARVALLLGCAQQVLEPDINLAVVDVLTRNGVEVVVPREQRCCGALAWHQGDLSAAQSFARLNLRAFPTDVDAVLTSAAGCGSALREYHLVLRGTLDEREGERFSRRVLDVSAFLTQLGLRELPGGFDRPTRVVYQDACHLLNAQHVRDEPRDLLRTIPNLSLCELDQPHLCCGSAGTYNLDQPEIAASLGQKKAEAIVATGAEMAVTGNIGCLIQLRTHLARLGAAIPIRHTFQLLRDAYNRA